MHRLLPVSRGRSTEVRKMPKVYVCDSGMVNRFARLDIGHLFENSVFQNLRARGELNYYQRKSGVEIDFILDKKTAYEVKINPRDAAVRKLKELSRELGLQDWRMVSKNHSELEDVIYGFML
jgi:predicted AAA+ superfamily ATPase